MTQHTPDEFSTWFVDPFAIMGAAIPPRDPDQDDDEDEEEENGDDEEEREPPVVREPDENPR